MVSDLEMEMVLDSVEHLAHLVVVDHLLLVLLVEVEVHSACFHRLVAPQSLQPSRTLDLVQSL